MKKKRIVMALTIIAAGAFVSVLAQSNFTKLPGIEWFANSAKATINAPTALTTANNLVHDNHYPTSGTFISALGRAIVTQHQDGDIILIMSTENAEEAHSRGNNGGDSPGTPHDLLGTLTLKMSRDASGTTITGGEWAYNVSYTEVRHVANPEPGGEDHAEFLVQRGTLKGVITGGQATLDGSGAVTAINSIQLQLNGGSLTFHDANSGTGSGQMSNIQDHQLSTGTLNLSF